MTKQNENGREELNQPTAEPKKKTIAQNTAQAESVLANENPRKELTESEIEVNKIKQELKEAEKKARAEKEAMIAAIKAKQAALKEIKEREKELMRKAREEKKATKKEKTESEPSFTRLEAMGEVMRAHPNATADEYITLGDALYSSTAKKESNLKESKWAYRLAKQILKGYNKE